MVATLTWVLAPVPASGLIRQRSGHHYEVRLGLGIYRWYINVIKFFLQGTFICCGLLLRYVNFGANEFVINQHVITCLNA